MLKDFYYSAEQDKLQRDMIILPGCRYFFKRHNGILFTEQVESGKKPKSEFPDMTLVSSGDSRDCTYTQLKR